MSHLIKIQLIDCLSFSKTDGSISIEMSVRMAIKYLISQNVSACHYFSYILIHCLCFGSVSACRMHLNVEIITVTYRKYWPDNDD